MKQAFANFMLQRTVPLIWRVALWLLGAASALAVCYAKPRLGEIAQATMFVTGMLILAAWYHYTRVSVLTRVLNDNSLALTALAVLGSVLAAIPLTLMTPS